MNEIPTCSGEERRLRELSKYSPSELESDPALDDLVGLAAQICAVPIAMVSLVAETHQWFKSGLGIKATETPRDISFCTRALGSGDLFIVPDTARDERFAASPLVTGEPHAQFYAGAPLMVREGVVIGTLCVMDRKPRMLDPEQEQALRVLARQVVAHLELARRLREIAESEERSRLIVEASLDAIVTINHEARIVGFNPVAEAMFGRKWDEVVGQLIADVIIPEEDRELHMANLGRYLATGESSLLDRRAEITALRRDGSHFPVEISSRRLGPGEPPLFCGFMRDLTQSREAALATSRLAAIVESSRDSIIGMDLKGVITSWNKGAETIFGFQAGEMVGTSVFRLIPAGREGEEKRLLSRIQSGENVETFETLRLTKDQHLIDVSVTASPIRDASGRVVGTSKLARNITARKQALEALRASEERLRVVTENARVGLVMINRERRYTFANSTYAEILGLPSAEITGLRVADVLSALYEDQIRPRLNLAFAGERVVYELHRTLPEGDRFYSVRYEPRMGAGVVSHVVVVITEITESKLRDDQLKLLGTCVDRLNDIVIITEAEPQSEPGPRILFVNDAFLRRTGYTREEVIGRSPRFLQGPKTSRVELDRVRKSMKRWEEIRVELINYTKSGEEFWIELDIVPVADSSGWYTHWVAVERDISERKRGEAALREREEQLRLYAEHSPVAVAMFDTEMRYLVASRSWTEGFKLGPETVIGRSHYELFPEIPEHWLEVHRRCLAGAVEKCEQEAFTRADGSTDWLRWEVCPWRKADGSIGGIIMFSEDISGRMRTEEARRASEERYRTLFDYAPDGIIIADAEGRYLDGNASICRMLGYSRDEFVGLTGEDVVDTSELPHLEPALGAIVNRGDYHREWLFRRSDGATFPADVIATIMPDGKIMAMVRDTTERRRAEARMRRLVDSNVQGVMIANNDGHITSANEALLEMIGYSREDLAAGLVNWTELTPAEYAARDQRHIAEVTAKGHGTPYEKEFLRKDGSRVPVLLGVAAFEDDSGEGVCFVVDLTERKKLEQQFLRAQRMESIGTLAGGIAHDLNNVLGPIMMSIDLLKLRFRDEDSQEIIGMIGSSAKRGADLVRQVLSFARGVEGRRMEIQAAHLILDLAKIASETFPKNIAIKYSVPADLWPVSGDPTQLHQVLLNLCVNARDAMPGGGTLTLSAQNVTVDEQYAALDPEAEAGRHVLLEVADSGSGILPEVMSKIFDPFFTTKEVGQGTGLGLSTSLAIVKSHGGYVRVYSEARNGTTFRVYLPAYSGSPLESVDESAAELPRGRGETVLVVDDEPSVRQITRQTLEAFGYRVLVAADGAEAVALYATCHDQIDVVLTDMMMPVLDGPATISVLRKIDPTVKIIAASGLATDGHLARTASLGVSHFLPKPFTAEALLKVLRILLDRGETGVHQSP